MSILKFEEQKVVLIVPSKVASTSIKSAVATGMDMNEKDSAEWRKQNRISNREVDNSKYFVIGFVRNPYDRLVSCYHNQVFKDRRFEDQGINTKSTFKEFVDFVIDTPHNKADKHFRPQYKELTYNGTMLPHQIIKFENLHEGVKSISNRIPIGPLPHQNKTHDRMVWLEYYDDKMLRDVHHYYERDFYLFY